MSDFVLKSAQFRREREVAWRELEQLIELAESEGIEKLTQRDLHRLPTLYRGIVSSLSVARAISLDRNLFVDIGRAWFDFGLTLPDWPRVVLGYEYQYKDGSKSSLAWMLTDYAILAAHMRSRRLWRHVAVSLIAAGPAGGFLFGVLNAGDPDPNPVGRVFYALTLI